MMIKFKYKYLTIYSTPLSINGFYSLEYDVVNKDSSYSLKTPLESFMTLLSVIVMTRNDNALKKNPSPSATHNITATPDKR